MISGITRILWQLDAFSSVFTQVVKVDQTQVHNIPTNLQSNLTAVTPTPCTITLGDGAVSYITYDTATQSIQYIS